MHYYFSLQYSAIQKTILRHDRLWSMSGISMILSRLNEIILPEIAKKFSGKTEKETILVAGGGKFTARFDDEKNAKKAREDIIKELSTTFPMLEFQVSKPLNSEEFSKIREDILEELKTQKQQFRGYGLSFNPHFKVCKECGEYPAEYKLHRGESVIDLCRICNTAFEKSRIKAGVIRQSNEDKLTTIETIYQNYFSKLDISKSVKVPYDFEDMFSPKNKKTDSGEQQKKRMAVWFSDINSMKTKVIVWLNREETEVFGTFKQVKDVFSNIVIDALARTFPVPQENFLPFRIIIAGGDDFCIVMDEKYILNFVTNISSALHNHFDELKKDKDHPLNHKWLEDKLKVIEEELKKKDPNFKPEIHPYCFGGSFIVCSLHTPFSKIHEIGEELMKTAKKETDRLGNSVNWRIMAEEESQSDKLLCFEKPIFIKKNVKKENWNKLCFNEYLKLCKNYSNISSSQRHQIAAKIIEYQGKPEKLERWLIKHDSSEMKSNLTELINERKLRNGNDKNGGLMPERLATLLELLSIGGESDGNE